MQVIGPRVSRPSAYPQSEVISPDTCDVSAPQLLPPRDDPKTENTPFFFDEIDPMFSNL